MPELTSVSGVTVDPGRSTFFPSRRDPFTTLTGRELEVLAEMARGRSNQAIGELLGVRAKTVETHVRKIFISLDLHPEPEDHRRVMAVLMYLGARS